MSVKLLMGVTARLILNMYRSMDLGLMLDNSRRRNTERHLWCRTLLTNAHFSCYSYSAIRRLLLSTEAKPLCPRPTTSTSCRERLRYPCREALVKVQRLERHLRSVRIRRYRMYALNIF